MASTLFTAAMISGAVFIFIVIFIVLHKKAHNRLLARQNLLFSDLVWKNKLEIKETETINNCLLAIDDVNFILASINFGNLKEEIRLLDLWDVKSAQVVTEHTSIYEQEKGRGKLIDKEVSKLHLEVRLRDLQPPVNLPLYKYPEGIQDYLRIKERANYWAAVINNCIKELPHPVIRNIRNA